MNVPLGIDICTVWEIELPPSKALKMQDNHFLMSALQPNLQITSLALPTDSQMDRKMREENQELRNARVQEQVRARMMQKGSSSSKAGSVYGGKRDPNVSLIVNLILKLLIGLLR